MATLTERNIVLVSKDRNGNTCLDYPLTKAEQVEDLESYVKNHSTQLKLPLSIANGGTGQTTVAGVRNSLGLGNTTGAVPVANGGTGATSVAAAVKALLGSSAIGSSTKPLYYDGAALKACADSIGGGGIVAQLLEQNGYVKFANGLILQWGKTDSMLSFNYTNVTLPIAFSRACYGCVASVQTNDVDLARQSGNCVEYTTTLVRVGNVYCDANSSGKVSWFAYGI